MKTRGTLFLVLGLVLLACCASDALASGERHPFCSTRTLAGTYIYSSHGVSTSGGSDVYFEAGMESYDGRGNVVNVWVGSDSTDPASPERETGTYVINGDCTGTVTYTNGAVYSIFVSPTGDSFTFVKAGKVPGGTPNSNSGDEKRVSWGLILK